MLRLLHHFFWKVIIKRFNLSIRPSVFISYIYYIVRFFVPLELNILSLPNGTLVCTAWHISTIVSSLFQMSNFAIADDSSATCVLEPMWQFTDVNKDLKCTFIGRLYMDQILYKKKSIYIFVFKRIYGSDKCTLFGVNILLCTSPTTSFSLSLIFSSRSFMVIVNIFR